MKVTARSANAFAPENYGPLQPLVDANVPWSPLDGGKPEKELARELSGITAHDILAGGSQEMAEGCLAGLWLRLNELDRSHAISQDMPSTTGSFWHGIMHRREGDYGNSKYWFRRVGSHPVFTPLAAAARELAGQRGDGALASFAKADWDPFTFVDYCQRACGSGDAAEEFATAVQQAEWQLLFDYCYSKATS